MVRRTNGSSSGGNILIERQDIGDWTNWRDREWVDLLVRLCVVVLDVSELGSALERIIVPVQVAHPPRRIFVRMISYTDRRFEHTCAGWGSHYECRECCT